MGNEKTWSSFLKGLIFLVLLASCMPHMGEMISASQKRSSLPENYTRIIENPMIDRPALVLMLPVRHPAIGTQKRTAAMTATEKQMTDTNRNYLINRLLSNRFFRQILPNDDPDDPSLPVNTLIIESYVKQEITGRGGPGMIPTKTMSYLRLLDLEKKELARVDIVSDSRQNRRGLVEMTYKIDSTEVYRFEENINTQGYWEHHWSFIDSCLDRALAILYRKYKESSN